MMASDTMRAALCVIIVDNSVTETKLIGDELSKHSIVNPMIVETPNDLKTALRGKRPDVVLCSYSTSGFTPYHIADLLKESIVDIPLIVISGPIGEDEVIKLLKAGCSNCIQKSRIACLADVMNREVEEASIREESRALHRKLQKYQFLANQTNDAILFLDSQGNILDANYTAVKRYGYSYEELLAINIAVLTRKTDMKIMENQMKKAARKGTVFETAHYRKDGSLILVEVSSQSARFGDQELLFHIIRDVTQQKTAQEQLRASEINYRRLFESAKDGILILDAQTGKIDDVNPFLIHMLGYSRDELVTKAIWEIGSFKDIIPNRENFAELQEQKYIRYENRPLQTSAGKLIEVEFVSNVYSVNHKDVIQCNIRDITERVNAENEVKHERDTAELYLNMAGVIFVAIGKDEIVTLINSRGCEILGLKKEEILGKNWFNTFVPEAARTNVKQVFSKIMAGEPNAEEYYENPVLNVDGQERSIFWHNMIQRGDDGSVIGIFGSGTDITRRKLAEKALLEIELKYSSYIENAPDGVFVIDETGHFLEVNRAVCEMTGYGRDELNTMTIRDCLAPEAHEDGTRYFKRVLAKGSVEAELLYKQKNGSNRWWSINAVKLSQYRVLGFAKDITDRKRAEDELVHLSYHDSLTGLYNRRFFEEELKRLDTERNFPLSIIMGDINGLKLINDSFGHAIGDIILKKAAKVIKKSCRSDDIVARLGGDEFVIVLPKTDPSKTMIVINRIKTLVQSENIAGIELSLALGYDTKEDNSQKTAEILANAENNMYRQKVYERTSIRSEAVDIIMNTLFEKSNRESLHSNRVSKTCESIAIAMHLKKDDISQIRTAGLLHDIGKIGIEDTILNKADTLNDHEWKEMRKHPEAGWRILSSTKEFSQLAQFILEHHEKWNGTGYPKGLKGNEISVEARIIAIADAYDAMTSKRSYQKKISREDAIEEIKRCAGAHFDPQIVTLFEKLKQVHRLSA